MQEQKQPAVAVKSETFEQDETPVKSETFEQDETPQPAKPDPAVSDPSEKVVVSEEELERRRKEEERWVRAAIPMPPWVWAGRYRPLRPPRRSYRSRSRERSPR